MRSLKAAAVLVALIVLSMLSALATPSYGLSAESWERSCRVYIVAVSSTGEGVASNLTVTIRYPGSGRVYISTSPASEVDTQGSARLAAFAASLIAGVDMREYDFYYDIEAPSVIIGGPSAGAEMALATLELLVNGSCRSDIVATGMIQPDTSIGPVGGLKEKLEAAAGAGMKIFVVPEGQIVYTYYVDRTVRRGPFIFHYREPVTVNLSSLGEQLGVQVYQASTLLDLYNIAVHGHPINPPAPQEWPSTSPGLAEGLRHLAWRALNATESLIAGAQDSRVEDLVDQARDYENRSRSLLQNGDLLGGLEAAYNALGEARAAVWVLQALENDLDVTVFVNETLNTANETWGEAYNVSTSLKGLPLALEATSLLGKASYLLDTGLNGLDREDGRYKLPSTFFFVEIGGLVNVSLALSLFNASQALFNLSQQVEGPSIDLKAPSTVYLSTAKTLLAYTERLLQEAGAPSEGLGTVEYLVNLALTVKGNPLLRLGLSVAAMSIDTEIIRRDFSVPEEPARSWLEWIAWNRSFPGVEVIVSGNKTSTRLTFALLTEYIPYLVGGNKSTAPSAPVITPGPQPTPPAIPPESTPTRTDTARTEGGGGEVWIGVAAALIVLLAGLAALVVASSGRRGGDYGWPYS
ncbi:MAG: hypothetical protein F7C35_04115 [Desulfurococcales archaeon]|nr:hypothetical protein [Desulfurococcales archaeon]